jgi:hypothetical protein
MHNTKRTITIITAVVLGIVVIIICAILLRKSPEHFENTKYEGILNFVFTSDVGDNNILVTKNNNKVLAKSVINEGFGREFVIKFMDLRKIKTIEIILYSTTVQDGTAAMYGGALGYIRDQKVYLNGRNILLPQNTICVTRTVKFDPISPSATVTPTHLSPSQFMLGKFPSTGYYQIKLPPDLF